MTLRSRQRSGVTENWIISRRPERSLPNRDTIPPIRTALPRYAENAARATVAAL
jgi:hypothetical protein